MEQANPIAAELLRICAFLAPDAIPEELLVEALKTPLAVSEGSGEEGNGFSLLTPGQLHEATALLRAYSLLQRQTKDQTVAVHRLVQIMIREAIAEQAQVGWIGRVIGAVNRLFPDVAFSTWGQCARYVSQALVCAAWIAQRHLTLLEGASLLHRTGWYLVDRAQHAEAEPLYLRALAIREQELGASHPDTASSLNNLADLYYAQGKYAEAEPLYVHALAICERELGASHPSTALSLNNLAALYKNQGKYAEAEPLYLRALAICERELGASHPDTASSLNNLAGLYWSLGKYAEAEPLYLRALAIYEQELGAQHPTTQIIQANYTSLLAAIKQAEEVDS